MDLNDTPQLASYRSTVRAWLEQHASEAPAPQAPPGDDARWVAARRAWQRRLAESRLVAVTWPESYGGAGKGPLEQLVVDQELRRAGAPGVFDLVGIGQLGPSIIAHGSDAQKQRYLGPMLAADEVWCQLFSEPGAGSDLAAVRTRARRRPDGSWRLSGQKVWTTNAQHASFGVLLARTSPEKPKHAGLTMLIVPMDAPGVGVHPLRQISGAADFNEVFFDDVALAPGSELGAVDDGWRVAMTTLMFERSHAWAGADAFSWSTEGFASAIVGDPEARMDAVVRQRLGRVATELLALRFTGYRMLTALERGAAPGVEAGLSKITMIRAAIAGAELVCDALGPEALEAARFGELVSDLPGFRSAGGTDEILRNMVGERLLGLPTEPRLDKGVPFSDLGTGQAGA